MVAGDEGVTGGLRQVKHIIARMKADAEASLTRARARARTHARTHTATTTASFPPHPFPSLLLLPFFSPCPLPSPPFCPPLLRLPPLSAGGVTAVCGARAEQFSRAAAPFAEVPASIAARGHRERPLRATITRKTVAFVTAGTTSRLARSPARITNERERVARCVSARVPAARCGDMTGRRRQVENIRKQFAHDDAVVGDVIHSADPGAAGAV